MSAHLHTADFYTWAHQQSELLRQGRLGELDTDSLIEELDSMGARERRELEMPRPGETAEHLRADLSRVWRARSAPAAPS